MGFPLPLEHPSAQGIPFPTSELTSTSTPPPASENTTHTPHHTTHTHTHQTAAGNFNKAWADSYFLNLKVKEEGHHICKKRESKESICPLQLLSPKPGMLSHSR